MRLPALCAVFSCLVISLSASAATATLTFTNSSGTGTVLLTGALTAAGSGEYLITSASGTIDGLSISNLLAPGAYPSNASPNDNDLFDPLSAVQPTYFDYNGLSFLLAGGTYFNLYAGSRTVYDYVEGTTPTSQAANGVVTQVLVTPMAVSPEPSSLVLLGTGVLGVAWSLRRRLA